MFESNSRPTSDNNNNNNKMSWIMPTTPELAQAKKRKTDFIMTHQSPMSSMYDEEYDRQRYRHDDDDDHDDGLNQDRDGNVNGEYTHDNDTPYQVKNTQLIQSRRKIRVTGGASTTENETSAVTTRANTATTTTTTTDDSIDDSLSIAAAAGGGVVTLSMAMKKRAKLYGRHITPCNQELLQFCLQKQHLLLSKFASLENNNNTTAQQQQQYYLHPTNEQLTTYEKQLEYAYYLYHLRTTTIEELYGLKPTSLQVYTVGSGDCNQLGVSTDTLNAYAEAKTPRLVTTLHNSSVIQVACGGLHNAALTEGGMVYTWGCNDDGSLGWDDETVHSMGVVSYLPALVKFHASNTSSSSGSGSGNNSVGDNDDNDSNESKILINRVSAGELQTLCLSLDGKVYMFGAYKDKEGKCFRSIGATSSITGNEDDLTLKKAVRERQRTPIEVRGVDKAEDIACGASFNLVLLEGGKMLSWGIGQCGELGRGPVPEIKSGDDNYNYSTVVKELLTPLPPLFPDGISRPVVKIACGAYHFLCTTISTNVDGVGTRLYTCGLNNYGQLGHGDTTNRSTMARVTKLDQALVKCIAAGYHHSLVTDNDGNIIAFGRGDYGQLGITDETPKEGYCETLPVYVPLPTDNDDEDNNDPVKEVSCGDHQCFAVTQGGALWSWGYGESSAHGHGNKDVLTPRILDLAEKIKDTSLMNFSEIGGAMGGGQHSVFLVGTEQKKRKRERRSTSESLADRKQN